MLSNHMSTGSGCYETTKTDWLTSKTMKSHDMHHTANQINAIPSYWCQQELTQQKVKTLFTTCMTRKFQENTINPKKSLFSVKLAKSLAINLHIVDTIEMRAYLTHKILTLLQK